MGREIRDLCGKVCPYPVVEIHREIDQLRSGEAFRCIVDDPLVLKSVPEEIEDTPGVSLTIAKLEAGWEITVVKE